MARFALFLSLALVAGCSTAEPAPSVVEQPPMLTAKRWENEQCVVVVVEQGVPVREACRTEYNVDVYARLDQSRLLLQRSIGRPLNFFVVDIRTGQETAFVGLSFHGDDVRFQGIANGRSYFTRRGRELFSVSNAAAGPGAEKRETDLPDELVRSRAWRWGQGPERRKVGGFDRTEAAIYFRGAAEPIVDSEVKPGVARPGQITISPDGRYAAIVRQRPEPALLIADSKTRRTTHVADGEHFALEWWPERSPED
jgi:hypothetical protein